MDINLHIDPHTGTVSDSLTGHAYGRVTSQQGMWVGITRARLGQAAQEYYRPTRRLAALAVAAAYVLGFEQ